MISILLDEGNEENSHINCPTQYLVSYQQKIGMIGVLGNNKKLNVESLIWTLKAVGSTNMNFYVQVYFPNMKLFRFYTH